MNSLSFLLWVKVWKRIEGRGWFSVFIACLAPQLAWAQSDDSSTPVATEPSGPRSLTDIWRDISSWFANDFSGIPYDALLTSFAIVLVTFVLRRVIARGLFATLKKLASRTDTEWDDKVLESLEKPMVHLIVVIGLYIAHRQLPFSPYVHEVGLNIFQGATIVIVFYAVLRLMNVVTEIMIVISTRKGHAIGAFMPLINKAIRVFMIMLCAMIVIQNLGYNIGTIIGALGIGGAAFAFAAKDSIANFYGSLALALDRPFKVGDWIVVGNEVDGEVEEIGLRSTKVRTWPKTVMSIPNSVLASENINNWSRMPKRRVKQTIGVTYASSPENMNGLVEDIRTILREDEGVQQDFILVNFTDFGESSLNILIYYFTGTIKWLEYMDIRQRINCKIMQAVEARGMSMAFPTRTLHWDGPALASQPTGDMPGSLPGDSGPMSPP